MTPRHRHAVIVSSYNRPKMVRDAISSVLRQGASVQLLVADDDSDDETRRAIQDEFTRSGSGNCTLLSANRPRGIRDSVPERATACINAALAVVDAEFVHYLPDDDWFGAGRFEAFERFFDAHPEIDVAYGAMLTVDLAGTVLGHLFRGTVLANGFNNVDHGSFCHRARVLQRVPRWPAEPHYAFDANFMTELAVAGYELHPVRHVVNYKRTHERNLMSERNRESPPTGRE